MLGLWCVQHIPSLTIKIKPATGRLSVLTRRHWLSQAVSEKQLQLFDLESSDNKYKRKHNLWSTSHTNTFKSWLCVNLTQVTLNHSENKRVFSLSWAM